MNSSFGDLTVGCDPEFFLCDKEKREPKSAHDLLPGTKEEPFRMKNGWCHPDGVAVEFAIDPVTTEEEWLFNIQSCISELREMIDDKYEFVYKNTVKFPGKIWNELPKSVLEIGCDPEYNSYNNFTVFDNNVLDQNYYRERCAGGHVHLGWVKNPSSDYLSDPTHITNCFHVISMFNFLLKNFQFSFDQSINAYFNNSSRIYYYGSPGACRIKPYGVESRFLSNNWIASDIHQRIIFRAAKTSLLVCTDKKITQKSFQDKYGDGKWLQA